ncbi:mechanosensitive ion channel family protein [Hydrogenimonas urashimensis]|uniref:mechanosensitive ion channel family protein n=1 Tax=Hydrogenimonas urashimensis TaxID=2740515 RepID=UPI001914FB60|nr:mechanosensitive ion channel domain-containing protein [Hydrogenimonas urashimensis]
MIRQLFLLFLVSFSLLAASDAKTSSRPIDTVSTLPQETPRFFALDEIPEAATEAASRLSEMEKGLETPREIQAIESSLPHFIRSIEKIRKEIVGHDLSSQNIKQLRQWYETSMLYQRQLETYGEKLKHRIDIYTDILKSLKEMHESWEATKAFAKEQKAPEAILQRASNTVAHIEAMQKRVKKAYNKTLTYIDMISGESRQFGTMTTALEEALAKRGMELLTFDHPPIFESLSKEKIHPVSYLFESAGAVREIVKQARFFYTSNTSALYAHMGTTLLLGFLMLFLYVRHRRGKLFPVNDEKVQGSVFFVEHPLAATVLLAVLIVPLFYPERPVSVGQFNTIVALSALLVIIHRIVTPEIRRYIYLLTALFLLNVVQAHIVEAQNEARLVWLLMALIMLAASLRLMRKNGPLHHPGYSAEIRFFIRLAPLLPLILVLSAGANIVGAVNLSVKLLSSLITSLILFMVFIILARIFRGLIVMFVRRRSIESKHLLREYAHQIQNYLTFVANFFLMAYWLFLVLKQFDLLYYMENGWQKLMSVSWKIGEVVVSVGAIVDFVLVLVLTWFFTRFITIILDLELFSRYEFPRGVPAAIQMIVRYLIITTGVVFALTVLGVRLTDLSIIAGALGVGIGFGLRNIMANFVSGLLLVFERPVQQGDVVEVDGIFGDVQKIGVRATTIKTYDGSEVIVPNADFITKEVINWTLSSKSRRVKMHYKVAFGNSPKRVIDIIRSAIEKHPGIRKEPAPKVLFEGYGDYYLEFTVYFWVDEKLLDIKSETAIDIYEALTNAGIEMPVPYSRVTYENPRKLP